MIAEALQDRTRFARWFGQYNTAPKNPEIDWGPDDPAEASEIAQALADGHILVRNPASRFAFTRDGASSALLFVDGHCFAVTDEAAAFAQAICAETALDVAAGVSPSTLELITVLFNTGSLAFEDED
jgi:50S ribosomal protein L16 3-hydroxylase